MFETSTVPQLVIPSAYFGLAIFMVHGVPLLLLCMTLLGGGIALLHLLHGAFDATEVDEPRGSHVVASYGYAPDGAKAEDFTFPSILPLRGMIARAKQRIKKFHKKYIKFIAAS